MKQLSVELTKWVKFQRSDETLNIIEVYDIIKNGALKNEIEAIRRCIATAKIAESLHLKKQLPAVSFSASYRGDRTKDNIDFYNGIIAIDIDDLDLQTLKEAKQRAMAIDHSVLVFESPSGLGLKVVVIANVSLQQHEQVFNQICDFYEAELGVKTDRSTKDVSRLCFLSYDTDCYFNPDAVFFKMSISSTVNADDKLALSLFEESMKYAVSYTERKGKFEATNRNNFIFALTSNCNRYGLDEAEVLRYLIRQYVRPGFPETEIEKTVTSCYKNYK